MKRILTLLVLLTSFLLSNTNFVDIYRSHGINAVEKLLNKELTKKEYWKKSLKNRNITTGYYESLKYLLVCNKNLSDIKIYDNNTSKVLFNSSVITGEKIGDKKLEGDLKTPIGVYELKSKLTKENSKLDKFYGPLALTTNYPNKFDKTKGKTGNGIWIHGVPYKDKRDPYTKGCIALQNENLLNLESKIDISKSLLVISEKDNLSSNINHISSILSQIYLWRDSWKYNNLEEYMTYYSSEFKRANGTNLKKFKKYKRYIFNKQEKKKILFTNINIIPYPNDLNKIMYKISMHEDYKTKKYTYVGKKELFIELIDNKMKILFE